MTTDEFQRLMLADSLLASADGLHIATLAAEWGASEKTVQRFLALLREIGQRDEIRRDPATGRYTHHYARGIKPLFRATKAAAGRRRQVDHVAVLSVYDRTKSLAETVRELGVPASTVRDIVVAAR